MKWITLLPTLCLLGCQCVGTEVLESPQVTAPPAPKQYRLSLVEDKTTIDVTNTRIKYY